MKPSSLSTSLIALLRKLSGKPVVNLEGLPHDFSAEGYLEANPDVAALGVNPYEHYLRNGLSEGRRYTPHDPKLAALTFLLPPDFDAEAYRRANPDLMSYTGDLRIHYIDHGLRELRQHRVADNAPPSRLVKYQSLPEGFDHVVYQELNPEVVGSPAQVYEHYLEYGVKEQRAYRYPDIKATAQQPFDAEKKTLLLVSHEASRTGAPVLSWNICAQLAPHFNIVVLLLADGGLRTNFESLAQATYVIHEARANQTIADQVIRRLHSIHGFSSAIVNSIECSNVCRELTTLEVPNLVLIHEFSANTFPKEKFLLAETWATQTIFSTQLTKHNACLDFQSEVFRASPVLPQGRCQIPEHRESGARAPSVDIALDIAQRCRAAGMHLIIGAGSVCYRKGVDLFANIASQMLNASSTSNCFFLWIGGGYPDYDPEFSAFIDDLVQRSNIESRFAIAPETDNLAAIYDMASLLLLPSRLDPLPNVAIDAICTGLPMVCFDKVTGIADVFQRHGVADVCVARMLDVSDMVNKAGALLMIPEVRSEVLTAYTAIQRSDFSMAVYADKLLSYLDDASERSQKLHRDAQALAAQDVIDADCYFGADKPGQRQGGPSALSTALHYLVHAKSRRAIRKPFPGFNPLLHRERFALPPTQDPLLHFLQMDAKDKQVLPDMVTEHSPVRHARALGGKVALHVHCYYIDLLDDILGRLAKNTHPVDVFVTTDTEDKAAQITQILHPYRFPKTHVSITPNGGRDIFPFMTVSHDLIDQYEIIGHVHTKKSPHVESSSRVITLWRELLLGNVLGSSQCEAMADRVITHLLASPELDLVLPDDPHILGWGANHGFLRDLMPDEHGFHPKQFFDFPVGTMFWARTRYLQQFVDMALPSRFAPKEPLPIDGTVLHAVERLFGAMADKGVPRYALSHVTGLMR